MGSLGDVFLRQAYRLLISWGTQHKIPKAEIPFCINANTVVRFPRFFLITSLTERSHSSRKNRKEKHERNRSLENKKEEL